MKQIYIYLFVCLALVSCSGNPGNTPAEKIDDLIAEANKDGEFTGAVLVADQGKPIYHKNFGMANAAAKTPVTDSTRFLIGSLSKPFTAVLILQLAEQGKLNVQDKISKYFESAAVKSSNVTIHQLLTHTSGLKEMISEKYPFSEAGLLKAGFDFEPGAEFKYSNTGFVILKEIAQKASGKKYEDLIKEQIFIPAGMTASGIARDLKQIPNLALGYQSATQAQVAIINYSLQTVDGAGSIYATVTDLFKFDRALVEGKLLSAKSNNLMLQQHVKEKYGYGWYLRERSGNWDVSYHKGNLPGYTAFMSRQKGKNQAIILLANADNLDLADIENQISKSLK